MSSVILKVDSVSKEFDRTILDNVSFEVKNSEIFGLIGLNGMGKTTIIKSIISLLHYDSGSIKILDQDSKNPLSRSNIFYLPEKFQPSKFLTGYEFVKTSLSFFNKKIDESKLEEICKSLDIDKMYLKKLVSQCSKGTVQKFGLLSCFLSEADLLILDEPMSGLDVRARYALKNTMRNYKNSGKSILFSSHILPDMEDVCDRVGVFHDKVFKFIGTVAEFKQNSTESLESIFIHSVDSLEAANA